MANYDDIFNASQSVETDEKSYSSFDKEEWAAQKKQEREEAFALIDTTAEHMANDGALFQSYLDVQAHFDRYSVGNALLITAQRPEATQLADSKSWRENGVYIKKGEVGIVLLEPGEEFTKEDGSVGVSYNSKKPREVQLLNAPALIVFMPSAKAISLPDLPSSTALELKTSTHPGTVILKISSRPENPPTCDTRYFPIFSGITTLGSIVPL